MAFDTFPRHSLATTRRTVPRNHECATPASVNPSRSTPNPVVNTAVFAAAAPRSPGDGSEMKCRATSSAPPTSSPRATTRRRAFDSLRARSSQRPRMGTRSRRSTRVRRASSLSRLDPMERTRCDAPTRAVASGEAPVIARRVAECRSIASSASPRVDVGDASIDGGGATSIESKGGHR